MFLPFVENAVKHGIDGANFLNIKFDINDGNLLFEIENSKPARALKREVGGIGLENVKRRLELIYPDTNHLEIENKNDIFSVRLDIPI